MENKDITMTQLDPIERRRTYHYKSGATVSIENVTAIQVNDGWDRLRTLGKELNIVHTVICYKGEVVDYVVRRSLDCDGWTI